MKMAVRSMDTAETAMVTDGDGSGGTSPSRQGAGTETFVPRNFSSMVAALQNCSGNFADFFRVFRPEASYRRRGVVRGQPGAPHTRSLAPLLLSFGLREASGENKTSGTCFVQF
jgi:hypothetical protein